jgi:diguanylate cyclase (GGDEF)-like protein
MVNTRTANLKPKDSLQSSLNRVRYSAINKIISASQDSLNGHALHELFEGLMLQVCDAYDLPPETIFCVTYDSTSRRNSQHMTICAAAGQLRQFVDKPLSTLNDTALELKLQQTIKAKKTLFTEDSVYLYLSDFRYEMVLVIMLALKPSEPLLKMCAGLLNAICHGYNNIANYIDLHSAAYLDFLTKLPNRNEFIKSLNVPNYSSAPEGLNVLLVDLNHFSDVNDALGQSTGDMLLRAVVKRIQSSMSTEIKIGRVGADVFGIIGPKKEVHPDQLNLIFATPFRAGQYSLHVSVNMGGCFIDGEYDNGADIFRRCDLALNRAKKNTAKNYYWYSFEMEQKTLWRIELIRRLADAFNRREIEVWFQPQVNIQTRKICGVETLLRWRDSGQFISPTQFISAAEYSGLIIELGGWVFKEALRTAVMLQAQGFENISIAINVSIIQLRSKVFVNQVEDLLAQSSVIPSMIEIEVTESVAMDEPEMTIACLNQLKALGLRVAIDDFGTGFSSLNYLQKMPLDRIKIDKQFVAEYQTGKTVHIVEMIISLAKKLNLNTVAEGVEKEAQVQMLKEAGCDQVQGFYFARPMPLSDLFLYLKSQFPHQTTVKKLGKPVS